MSIARVNSIVDSVGGNNVSVAGKTFITSTDTIASNNNDTTIPTSAAVKAYADAAIAAAPANSMTLLGTIATTSGSTRTLSGLTLTGYKALFIAVDGVSTSGTGDLNIDTAGCSPTLTSANNVLFGIIWVALANGAGMSIIGQTLNSAPQSSSTNVAYALRTRYTTASTSISFSTSSVFDAGSILVYGVK